MILSLDTATGTSVALVDSGTVIAVAEHPDTRGHAEVIGNLLQSVLHEHRHSVTQIVVGMGPGPFTGLRVGVAAAHAASVALDVPLLGVSSHDGIGCNTEGDVLVTSDVRRRERAWSRYIDGSLVAGPSLAPADEVPSFDGAQRIDIEMVHAVDLALAVFSGRAKLVDEPIYLRDADAVPGAQGKRVSQ
ncbi:tRNA (adenosine(37)-N6)-threonylcarbamoyltransferase complex dimerization subunit type 1 TsaB [Humidisolicoccus flavus]|uniref:tRNA (adenosine(37)-N6)-threonylcarbamoyltransferase complex dimerization subunit type 1 TsaB n=1 Tax=Humidisolicoccus flavus TaxID=3111414 RepID=UPI003248ABC9